MDENTERTIDITAVSKLKHTVLWQTAKKLGSQAALARELGISPSELGSFVNLQRVPSRRMSEERRAELDAKLYALTGKGLDEIFPDALRDAEVFLKSRKTQERTITIEASSLLEYAKRTSERLTYVSAECLAEQKELRAGISQILKTLHERERKILTMRYGLEGSDKHTLAECAKTFGVSADRIRQIEAKAVRKLQQPSRSDDLIGFLDI